MIASSHCALVHAGPSQYPFLYYTLNFPEISISSEWNGLWAGCFIVVGLALPFVWLVVAGEWQTPRTGCAIVASQVSVTLFPHYRDYPFPKGFAFV